MPTPRSTNTKNGRTTARGGGRGGGERKHGNERTRGALAVPEAGRRRRRRPRRPSIRAEASGPESARGSAASRHGRKEGTGGCGGTMVPLERWIEIRESFGTLQLLIFPAFFLFICLFRLGLFFTGNSGKTENLGRKSNGPGAWRETGETKVTRVDGFGFGFLRPTRLPPLPVAVGWAADDELMIEPSPWTVAQRRHVRMEMKSVGCGCGRG